MEKRDRIAGGFYGLLIGDALGVPYEFQQADQLPPYEKIDMIPPAGFKRTYPQVETGTWSDDGAQALCLLDSLLSRKEFSLDSFSNMLLDWYENGAWAVGNEVFDVGVQTAWALYAYKTGLPARECGLVKPEGKGNGALMRVLPLALWQEDRKKLVQDAHLQCLITHGHICNQVCCALYCLAAKACWMAGMPGKQSGKPLRVCRRFIGICRSMNRSWSGAYAPGLPGRGMGRAMWWTA